MRGMQLVAFPPLGSAPAETWQAAAPNPEALAKHLWQVNPLLASAILRLLAERPYGRDEMYKYLGSAAYGGLSLSRPEFEHWLAWALLAGIVRPLGVAVALGAAGVWEALDGAFDQDAFLAAHAAADPASEPSSAPNSTASHDSAVVGMPMDMSAAANTAAIYRATPAASMTSAHANAWQVPPAVMRKPTAAAMSATALRAARAAVDETDAASAVAALVAARAPQIEQLTISDLDITGEHWQEDPERVLLRLGLVAALAFGVAPNGQYRDKQAVVALYRAIIEAQLLDALVEGHLPNAMPANMDAASLLLASVLARRLSEAPALPDELARATTLPALMTALDVALGRGLLSLELFWIARALGALGVVRFPGADVGPAIPWRPVRNALVRWGMLPSPYAINMEELTYASQMAAKFAVAPWAGDAVILAFEALGGCGSWAMPGEGQPTMSGCAKRVCLPFCRERTDVS